MSLPLMLLIGLLSAPRASDTASLIPTLDQVGPFLARVEAATPLLGERPRLRIERNDRGEVFRLYLDKLELSAADYAALAQLSELRYLSLRGTSATSADLALLRELPRLEHLVLTESQIDDDVLPHLIALPALKTICLINVAVSAETAAELKRQKPRLSLGYSPRRPSP